MVDEKDDLKDFKYNEEFIKKFIEDNLGLFRVYDRRTNETIGLFQNRWEANKYLWDGSGWSASRNHNEIEKVTTKAAKILYGYFYGKI